MRAEVNTAHLPLRKRLDHMRGALAASPIRGAIYATSEDYAAHSVSHRFGTSLLAHSKHAGMRFERTRKIAAADDAQFAAFWLGGSGASVIEQGGRDTLLEPGVLIAMDGEQPYRSSVPVAASFQTLYVPKAALGSRAQLVEDFCAISFGGADPVQRIAYDFMTSLFRAREAGLDNAAAQMLANQGVELMLLAIERGTGRFRKVAPSAYKSALARRITQYVEANLRNPKLSLAAAARTFGISERYVNLLLNLEDTSFHRLVMSRRLECCHAELRDPGKRSARISEIAFDWGFVSQAHFSRVFRQRYGLSPRDYRCS